MIRWHAIWSVLWRNVQSYFSGVLGYLVIVVFVAVAGFCAFSPRFFANNLANLDQLSVMFPLLLLSIVPAITMATWAEEKKQGTDEILFTLPATDLEILLAKYFSVLMIYTIVLAFSLTQLIALAWIGNPDWGVVFTTYLGYWLAGAALLSVGMFASVLTGNTTVAYVLGATFCAIPVLIGSIAPGNNFIQGLSLASQLREFTSGLIPMSGVVYFVGLTIVMLYLNYIFISKRHWSAGKQTSMGMQFALRAIAITAAVVALGIITTQSSVATRIDATEQGLFTLSDTTRETVKEAIEKERAVTIQAFVSPDVPREFVHQRKQLDGLLRQYDLLGKKNIDVRVVTVKPSSKEATEAKNMEIVPIRHKSEVAGKLVEQDVYMGTVVSSDLDEVVIPHHVTGTSMEYELTRALATVTSREERIKVGILETDLMRLENKYFPTFEKLMEKLKQQYKVVNVPHSRLSEILRDNEADRRAKKDEDSDETKNGEAELTEEEKAEKAKEKEDAKKDRAKRQKNRPDVLLVVQPSSLTRPVMDELTEYVEAGNPTLLLDDPIPMYPFTSLRPMALGVLNGPTQERPEPNSGLGFITIAPQVPVPPQVQMQLQQIQQQAQQMAQFRGPQVAQQMMEDFYKQNPSARPRFEPKGDMSRLMKTLGIEWDKSDVVIDLLNPQSDFSISWIEEMHGTRWPKGYGPKENLQLFVADRDSSDEDAAFSPDDPISNGLREMLFMYPGAVSKASSGKTEFIPLARSSYDSKAVEWKDLTENANVRGEFDVVRLREFFSVEVDDKRYAIAARVKPVEDKSKVNAVFVADIDFITDLYFNCEDNFDTPVDNLNFLFNAIEVLAGDEQIASLRNRRPKPHRLDLIQKDIDRFRRKRSEEQSKAEADMVAELEKAQKRLDSATEKIQEDEELGYMQKMQLSGMEKNKEQRRFKADSDSLQEELQETIETLKATEKNSIELVENRARVMAVLLPVLPALLLGCIVLLVRFTGEQSRVDSRRRK